MVDRMPSKQTSEETRNVLVSTLVIATTIIVVSLILLIYLTGNYYLSAYYALEIFFLASNSFAASTLSQLAIAGGTLKFGEIMGIQIVDNISRLLVISFVVAAVVDFVAYANLENLLNKFRIRLLSNHIIVCGSGDASDYIVSKLRPLGRYFVVIEQDRERAIEIGHGKAVTLVGNFTDAETLNAAAVQKAYAVLFFSQSDIDNLLGTVTARSLNKDVKIVARATKDDVRRKMYRAGADMCALPEYLAGLEIADKLVGVMKK